MVIRHGTVYDGTGAPKLFEFNCDTPTSLLEAAVIQWDWKQEVFRNNDQYNSLHERLVGKWADLRTLIPDRMMHFTHVADAVGEDMVTVAYLRDTFDRPKFGLATLTYHEGVSNAEAASILGIGVKALESLLVRARQGLSQQLARQGLLEGATA